jgi:diguanylate cyclase (GGDEF)-like protein
MKTKSKILLIVTIMLLALGIATIVNVALNFRDYSIGNAIEKSKMISKIVEDGLTAHMVNGIMDKRAFFLNQISKNDHIKSLWLVRSENVIKQYGKGLIDESPRDKIDEKVIKSGNTIREFIENTNSIILRVSIPYKAKNNIVEPNCLSCHDVAVGDTLGAISMEFDISYMRIAGTITILKILAINLVFIIIVLLLINKYVSPYTKLFENLRKGVTKAYRGNFTHRFETTISGEEKEIVDQMNILFEKMQDTFGNIKHNLSTFTPQNTLTNTDPLNEAKIIINELSDIYKFKKTIERDSTKINVYERIVDILQTKYNIKHFAFYEIDDIKQTRELIYISDPVESICFEEVNKKASLCRAYRTESDVLSTDFNDVCKSCSAKNKEYICTFFNINNEVSLVLSITANTKSEITRINSIITNIKHYLEAAKPVIESKVLTDKLRNTSLRDAMTGLYNRRFLEEFIDKVMSQVQREGESYSIMMLDVDFFKLVNDNYGHDIGDMVIVEIGKLLQNSIRESDLAIRYGGEEFIVMLHNADDNGTMKVAKTIHEDFAELIFDVGAGETIQKTMSIGISKFPRDGDTIWKCIKYADTALYSAKTTGRNKIVEYIPEMSEKDDVR